MKPGGLMTTVSTHFKGYVQFNAHNFSQSKVSVQIRHTKGWKPLFEFTAADMMKLFSKKQIVKRKR